MSFETGWCDICDCPIGLGPCGGCNAYAVAMAFSEPDAYLSPGDEGYDEDQD